MSAGLRLISLNIEGSKHLDLVLPFLKDAHADVICLQELISTDVPRFEAALGMESVYEPMTQGMKGVSGFFGIGILSRLPFKEHAAHYYRGKPEALPHYDPKRKDMTMNHMLLAGVFEKEGTTFHIGTTHFHVTPDGRADDAQRLDAKALLEILSEKGDIVFCGDFNAPRGEDTGREIYASFASRYEDRVPQAYVSSLDPALHRVGHFNRMVDYIWSTPAYKVDEVKMVCGVSDHCALVATIRK